MPLYVQTTGLEQYAPGGKARIKVLVIGGSAAGKTRWSSFFPKPIYADCEKGLASVADRRVPFVSIQTSQDMLDLLAMLKQESARPHADRSYHTVVIDTLDAFQRKIKNEWMEKERKQTFSGWEAWGYLTARMQMVMTRLLNLDMHVVVNCHYKDKTTKDDTTGRETHELMLQLQGEAADTTYNDFDLVGWMGTYWEAESGERVQKRGITFRATPEKPFLKDRLHVTPPYLEIAFAPSDYEALLTAVESKIGDLADSEVVGEIPTEAPTAARVIGPGDIGSGPLPPGAPPKVPLAQMDRPTLLKRARDQGVTQTLDGAPIKGNTLKGELVAALQAHQDLTEKEQRSEVAPARTVTETPALVERQVERQIEIAQRELAQRTAGQVSDEPGRLVEVPEGVVNTATGELADQEVSHAQAVENVEQVLGGHVVEDPPPAAAARAAEPDPTPDAPASPACAECGKDLANENPDVVKLSYIKFRQTLCTEDYQARKTARR